MTHSHKNDNILTVLFYQMDEIGHKGK